MIDTTPYKARLAEEKIALERELQTVAQPNPANPSEWEAVQKDTAQEADPTDQAGLLDQYQENRALVDVLNKRYKDVNDALTKIAEGTYGTCEVSGEPIEEERLNADPAARTNKAHME